MRINELRDAGFAIDTIRSPNGTADYFLRREPPIEPPAPIEPDDHDDQAQLFSTAHLIPHDQPALLPSREAA